MYHHVARSLPGTLLFRDWEEGVACWERIVRAIPNLVALVIMPDHVHLLHRLHMEPRLARALSGYIRWRNHRRRQSGSGIQPVPPAIHVQDRQKVRTTLRYIHLNPCRADLVADPLAWPLSTHRDLVGLAIDPVIPRAIDPDAEHARISGDPSVSVAGTYLPCANLQAPSAEAVAAAVSAVMRAPMSALSRRGPARRLYLRAARTLTESVHREIGSHAKCTRWAVLRVKPSASAEVRLVQRVAWDPRFPGLIAGDLRERWPERLASRE